jgi:hypothetical protein
LSLIIFCESEAGEQVFFLANVVSFDDGGEHGETIFAAQGSVKVVTVYTSNLLHIKVG